MLTSNDHNKFTLLSGLDSYIRFNERTEKIIDSFDDHILEIYEMDRDIEKILEVIKMHKLPGIDPMEQSIHALVLSIITNAKANKSHLIALRGQINAMDKLIKLYYRS